MSEEGSLETTPVMVDSDAQWSRELFTGVGREVGMRNGGVGGPER